MLPFILVGSLTVGFGFAIYLLLPLAFLQMNMSLVLYVFFTILMGMLLGITILVSNFQAILEVILMYLFLFWERRSMRSLLRKNLIVHRPRNKLTSIIYSLTLGSVIFLLVAATL